MPRLLLAGQKIGGYRGQKPVGAYDRFHTTIQRPAGEGERNNRCARQIWGDGLRVAFKERRTAPILIWRYLTETAGVDPAKVAVYCDLKFDKKFPRPAEFTLFSGGRMIMPCSRKGIIATSSLTSVSKRGGTIRSVVSRTSTEYGIERAGRAGDRTCASPAMRSALS